MGSWEVSTAVQVSPSWQLEASYTPPSTTVTLTALSPTIQFTIFFGLVFIIWILALTRQTLIMNILSSLGWFSFAGGIYALMDTATGIMQGMSLFGFLMGFIMVVMSVKSASDLLARQAAEKQRQRDEEIM